MIPLLLSALLGSGCNDAPVDTADSAAGSELVALDAPRLLRRASLDLRGTLPTAAELDAVEADPSALGGYLDAYMDDPALTDRLISFFAERFQTRLDVFEIKHYDYGLDASQEFAFERSVGEEPLRLIARVITEDLPWSEIVTADWTMGDATLASVWPLDYEEGASGGGEDGWQVVRYTDGRPAAGVLATNGLWWRYVTNPSNMNRARAAAITNLLTCQDILSRPVSFSESADLALSQEDAIRSDPGCMACHSSVDPIAATLFGFYWFTQYNPLEMTSYHPERENIGAEDIYLGVEPAWFGQPVNGLVDLGWYIAADPRFARCAAETAAELLWRRPVLDLDDFAQVESLRAVYTESDRSMKSVMRAALDTDVYRAGGLAADASAETAERELTARMLSPDQLASSVEDLTGFRWTYEGFDQLGNDTWGYRILAGGVDGENLARPQQDPGLTWALVIQRLAQGAASHAAEQAFVYGSDQAPIFDGVDGLRPGDAGFSDALAAMHWRLYATRADGAWLADAEALWTDAEALSDERGAWTTLLTAMLRDPAFVSY